MLQWTCVFENIMLARVGSAGLHAMLGSSMWHSEHYAWLCMLCLTACRISNGSLSGTGPSGSCEYVQLKFDGGASFAFAAMKQSLIKNNG